MSRENCGGRVGVGEHRGGCGTFIGIWWGGRDETDWRWRGMGRGPDPRHALIVAYGEHPPSALHPPARISQAFRGIRILIIHRHPRVTHARIRPKMLDSAPQSPTHVPSCVLSHKVALNRSSIVVLQHSSRALPLRRQCGQVHRAPFTC